MVKSQVSSEEVSAFMVKSACLLLLQGYQVDVGQNGRPRGPQMLV